MWLGTTRAGPANYLGPHPLIVFNLTGQEREVQSKKRMHSIETRCVNIASISREKSTADIHKHSSAEPQPKSKDHRGDTEKWETRRHRSRRERTRTQISIISGKNHITDFRS